MKAIGPIEKLDTWLKNPQAFAPGTAMAFPGVADDKKRADIIAFLRTNADTPAPLPEAAAATPAAAPAEAAGRACAETPRRLPRRQRLRPRPPPHLRLRRLRPPPRHRHLRCGDAGASGRDACAPAEHGTSGRDAGTSG